MSLFIDTSFLYAMEDVSDMHHRESLVAWERTLNNPPRIVSTSFIFDETVTLLQAKLGHAKAADIGNRLLHSSIVELIHVTPEIFEESWAYFIKHKDKGYSFTDCVSFTVMEELNIKNALAFDRHFRQAGFKVL
jgi:predicted nucleic acid-binding protein